MALGGVVLVLGTATLIWLVIQRQTSRVAAPPAPTPASAPGDLALPAGSRVEAVDLDGGHLVLLLRDAQDQQYLALIDMATGRRQQLLRIVPDAP